MKLTTFLLIIIILMHFTSLSNITVFNGDWNGIVMAINTILFILAIGMWVSRRKQHQ